MPHSPQPLSQMPVRLIVHRRHIVGNLQLGRWVMSHNIPSFFCSNRPGSWHATHSELSVPVFGPSPKPDEVCTHCRVLPVTPTKPHPVPSSTGIELQQVETVWMNEASATTNFKLQPCTHLHRIARISPVWPLDTMQLLICRQLCGGGQSLVDGHQPNQLASPVLLGFILRR